MDLRASNFVKINFFSILPFSPLSPFFLITITDGTLKDAPSFLVKIFQYIESNYSSWDRLWRKFLILRILHNSSRDLKMIDEKIDDDLVIIVILRENFTRKTR